MTAKQQTVYRETQYLRCVVTEHRPKTKVLAVCNRKGAVLGDIRGYGGWRQYTFNASDPACIFNTQCLFEIAEVLSNLNTEHAANRANREAGDGNA